MEGLFSLIVLILMVMVRNKNKQNPLKKHKFTPLRIQLIAVGIAFIIGFIAFYPEPGAIIDFGLNPFGAGIIYLIINAILNLIEKRSNKPYKPL